MADVRINGKRIPKLKTLNNLKNLMVKIDFICEKNHYAVTNVMINNKDIDVENEKLLSLSLDESDTVEIKLESPEQLSYESLSVAQDMADLLLFDLKVSTIRLWNSTLDYEPSLETLLKDCYYFLSLAARPIYLLNQDPNNLDEDSTKCLKILDGIASDLEDATFLSVHAENKSACEVLILKVKPAIETWVGLSVLFAEKMKITVPSKELEIEGI